jgi:uncharacterized membrane-anchored protein YjiN (DUF445 family)
MNTPTDNNPTLQQTKLQRLNRMKSIATGILILATVLFLVSKFLESTYPWLSYLRAFSEASMIGAMADWFAVTALFQHPLGLKIPHTNLLANKQENIGRNLGNFVTNNFLAEHTIAARLEKINVSTIIIQWLDKPENTQMITREICRFIPQVLDQLNDDEINTLIRNRANQFIQNTNFQKIASDLLQYFIDQGQHQVLLNNGIKILEKYLADPKSRKWIYDKARQNSPKLLPDFVSDYITDLFLNAVDDSLNEVHNNEDHAIRAQFNQATENLVKNLRESENYRIRIEEMKEKLIEGKTYQTYTGNLWGNIKAEILREVANENSKMRERIQAGVASVGDKLEDKIEWQTSLDNWTKKEILRLLQTNREWIAGHISNTVKNWDKREISDKLELEVGRDLQYIRLNGTLVGGFVGLFLHILWELLS